jgi:hypothetical protein
MSANTSANLVNAFAAAAANPGDDTVATLIDAAKAVVVSEDFTRSIINGTQYGDLHLIADSDLSAVASALFTMSGCKDEVGAGKVAIPAAYAKFIVSVKPGDRAYLAGVIEDRRRAVAPTWWDRSINFISNNRWYIVAGLAALAAGAYMYRDTILVTDANDNTDSSTDSTTSDAPLTIVSAA